VAAEALRGQGGGIRKRRCYGHFLWGRAGADRGITLLIMLSVLDIPAYTVLLRQALLRFTGWQFFSHQFTSFILAFLYLFIPAVLMGISFPLAAKGYTSMRRSGGRVAGELLASNTVGAILGASVCSFALLPVLGIERSLQLLCVINAGTGLVLLAGARERWRAVLMVLVVLMTLAAVLLSNGPGFRSWDKGYLATYTPDRAALYRDDRASRQQVEAHEVLYYAEGNDAMSAAPGTGRPAPFNSP